MKMKTVSILALVAFIFAVTIIGCGGAGCAQAQAQTVETLEEPQEKSYIELDKADAAQFLAACRLGHYEHAYELGLTLRWSMLEPEDIGATQEEIDAYLKLGKIRELVPAMNRIRAGQASPDGAAWVTRQLNEHSLRPADIGTSWNELRNLGAVNVN